MIGETDGPSRANHLQKEELMATPRNQVKDHLAMRQRRIPDNLDLSVAQPGDVFRVKLVEHLADGGNIRTFVKEIMPGSGPTINKKRKRLRHKVRSMIQRDPRTIALLHDYARGEAQLGLLPALRGLIERAERGRPDAVKPLMEITGFHNPKRQVEHSGEVRVVMDIPRPALVPAEDEVIDVEAIEE